MKKFFVFVGILAAFAASNCAYAIEEINLDLSDEKDTVKEKAAEQQPSILFGEVKEKEIYSYSNYAESLSSVGASVDVVSRTDIEKQGNPTLSELLSQQSGLFVQNSMGSLGSPSSVRLRGTDRVRMTIDGIRADRPSMTSPGIEPEFILADDIERIEVIKGAIGNVGGTNASGGLIAMQTRRGKGPFSMELGSEMGNLGTFKERFAVMGGDEKKDYYLSLTWFKTDGGMRTTDLGRIHNDDYNNLSLVSNTGMRVLNNKADLRNIFRFSRARKDNGIGYHNAGDYSDYQAPDNYALNYDIMDVVSFEHNPNEKYNYNAKFGVYHNESDNYILPDGINYDPLYESISKIGSTRLNFMSQHNYKIFDWNTLSAGYNLESEFIDATSHDVSTSWMGGAQILDGKYSGNTIQNDVFINDSINIKDKLFIRGGARLINNSDFGTHVTPNASAALVLPTFNLKAAKTKFRGSWGQSVNNPTLYQRFATADFGWLKTVANPDLDAEKMTGWDAGVTQSFFDEKLSFDFGYFNNRYKDYLSYQYNDDFTIGQYQNIDSARIQGYEGKITFEPTTWIKAIVSYTYTDSEDLTTHNDLPGCPRNSVKSTIYWTPCDRFNMYATVESASGRSMSSTSMDPRTGTYVDVRVGANVKLFSYKGADVYLRGSIYNLLDQDISMYKTANNVSYYAPGINFRTGIFVKYNLPEKENL